MTGKAFVFIYPIPRPLYAVSQAPPLIFQCYSQYLGFTLFSCPMFFKRKTQGPIFTESMIWTNQLHSWTGNPVTNIFWFSISFVNWLSVIGERELIGHYIVFRTFVLLDQVISLSVKRKSCKCEFFWKYHNTVTDIWHIFTIIHF